MFLMSRWLQLTLLTFLALSQTFADNVSSIATNSASISPKYVKTTIDSSLTANSGGKTENVTLTPLAFVDFEPKSLKFNMYNSSRVSYIIRFYENAIKAIPDNVTVAVSFTAITQSPQFNIISLLNTTHDQDNSQVVIRFNKAKLKAINYVHSSNLTVEAIYIGRASIVAQMIIDNRTIPIGQIDVVSYREDGILELLFKISAITIVVVNFFNIGTQLDGDRINKLLSSPRITLVGLFITIIVMPLVGWLAGYWLVHNQINFWFGAFLVGTCPTASSGPFYVLMLKGDKELGVTLQLISTITATFTMPLWLMTLGSTITQERFLIKVPYLTLVGSMLLLLKALALGYSIGRCSKSLSQFIARVIRPFTLIVVTYLVLFSAIAYWFIFRMFDWRLTLLGSVISLATCIVSALVAAVFKRDIGYVTTISVMSSYKNTGIAFAILLVAMPNPDCFIAFIPCLTQILSAAVIIYLLIFVLCIYDKIKNRNDTDATEEEKKEATDESAITKTKLSVSAIDTDMASPEETCKLKSEEDKTSN